MKKSTRNILIGSGIAATGAYLVRVTRLELLADASRWREPQSHNSQ